jgi:hypothetical protein
MISKKLQKLIDELNEVEKNDKSKWKEAYSKRLQKLTTDEVELLFSGVRESEDAWHHAHEWKSAIEETW